MTIEKSISIALLGQTRLVSTDRSEVSCRFSVVRDGMSVGIVLLLRPELI